MHLPMVCNIACETQARQPGHADLYLNYKKSHGLLMGLIQVKDPMGYSCMGERAGGGFKQNFHGTELSQLIDFDLNS